MKLGSVFQSSLLAAGILLIAAPALQADTAYTVILRDGHHTRHAQHHPGCRHDRAAYRGHHHHHGHGHYPGHGKRHYRNLHRGLYGDHGHGASRPEHGRWLRGGIDVHERDGRRRQGSRHAGIGYTGRS